MKMTESELRELGWDQDPDVVEVNEAELIVEVENLIRESINHSN